MHDWGDKDFDWKGLDEAGKIIMSTCEKYGRFGTVVKEKWGCLRFSCDFGITVHGLMKPGYMYNHHPKWIRHLELNYIDPALQFLFGRVWVKWQEYVYGLAYARALEAYAHLKDEILHDCDYPHLVKGAQEVHDKYWKSYKDSFE